MKLCTDLKICKICYFGLLLINKYNWQYVSLEMPYALKVATKTNALVMF